MVEKLKFGPASKSTADKNSICTINDTGPLVGGAVGIACAADFKLSSYRIIDQWLLKINCLSIILMAQMQKLKVTDSIEFAYADSGAPSTGEDYTTFILIHGHTYHSGKVASH